MSLTELWAEADGFVPSGAVIPPPPSDWSDVLGYAEQLAVLVARSWLEPSDAFGCLALFASQRHSRDLDFSKRLLFARWLMGQRANSIDQARALTEHRVRRAAWPLCEERRPGVEILRVAESVVDSGGLAPVLPDAILLPDEILEICRTVARQASKRRGPSGRQ